MRKIATTGIWKIEKRLDHVIDYTTNIEKTLNSEYVLMSIPKCTKKGIYLCTKRGMKLYT